MVAIDYLQLMSAPENRESRQIEISAISRGLKSLAKELEIPVLSLAQEADWPLLSHLRDSGSIEQDADKVMFIHRKRNEEVLVNSLQGGQGVKTTILVAKNRNGPTGHRSLVFLKDTLRFEAYGGEE